MAVTTRNGSFIGGEWVAGEGEEIEVRNPATGELLGIVTAASLAQVDQAVAAAAEAFRDVAEDVGARPGRDSAATRSRSAWIGPRRSRR